MSNEVETFLAHFGVKGMKWGVRRKLGIANLYGANDKAYHPADNFKDRVAKARILDVTRSGIKKTDLTKPQRVAALNQLKADLGSKPMRAIRKDLYERDKQTAKADLAYYKNDKTPEGKAMSKFLKMTIAEAEAEIAKNS